MLATRDKVQYRLGDSPTAESPDRAEQVILVGNPNVGKSVVFGYLTGTYVTVSNYPGTTVEISGGKARHQGREIEIVDTPGTNSILPNSEDEKVTRDILFKAGQKVVLQVGDAKNLFRTLYLTVQLLETNLPLMLNLNMLDEAKSSGIQIDFRKLEGLLGIPVNGSVAVRKQGLDTLLDRALAGTPGHLSIDYGAEIESAVSRVSSILPDLPISKRAAALMILAGDATLKEWLHEKVPLQQILRIDETMAELSKALGAPVDVSLARIRIRKVNEIIAQVQQPSLALTTW